MNFDSESGWKEGRERERRAGRGGGQNGDGERETWVLEWRRIRNEILTNVFLFKFSS